MTERDNEQVENSEIGFQSMQIAELLGDIGEEFGFDEETLEEFACLLLSEAIEMAYGYLAQAGFDPEDVLCDFLDFD